MQRWTPPKKHNVISGLEIIVEQAHLCVGSDSLNNGLRSARDVGEVELGAAALLHTAAHQQLVVAPVDCQHLPPELSLSGTEDVDQTAPC